jgi:hypothetical protein
MQLLFSLYLFYRTRRKGQRVAHGEPSLTTGQPCSTDVAVPPWHAVHACRRAQHSTAQQANCAVEMTQQIEDGNSGNDDKRIRTNE